MNLAYSYLGLNRGLCGKKPLSSCLRYDNDHLMNGEINTAALSATKNQAVKVYLSLKLEVMWI
jgi:hypothetical protein